MNWHRVIWFLLVLVLGSGGCGDPEGGGIGGGGESSAPLPPLDRIEEIRLCVEKPFEGAVPVGPCEATLTKADDIAKVLDWLKTIDWSQEGSDLTVIDIEAPDGSIVISTKDGKAHNFGFYWNGNFINEKANRLIRGGDMAQLRRIIQRLCKGVKSSGPFPPLDQTEKVQFRVVKSSAGKVLQPPCEATLTKADDIAKVLDWLKTIDWSQEGSDLTVIKIPAPDGDIVVSGKDDTSYNFGFYWNGDFIIGKTNRLIRGGDMAQLDRIIKQACE